MKHIYKNLDVAVANGLKLKSALGNYWQTLHQKHEIRLSATGIYLATLGFKDLQDLEKFRQLPSKDKPHSNTHWEFDFSLQLERKYVEESEAKTLDELVELFSQVCATHVKPFTIGNKEFDELSYGIEANGCSLAYSEKLLECLRTKSPIFASIASDQNDLSSQRSQNTRSSANSAAARGSITAAQQYQKKVLEFASWATKCLGRKNCRESGIWSLEFAYDLYAASLKKWPWSVLHLDRHPVDFLNFFATELGYQDYDSYAASQREPETANYDSRPDSQLSDSAQRMRKKMREGYLWLYLVELKLPDNELNTAFLLIKECLTSDLYLGFIEGRASHKTELEQLLERHRTPLPNMSFYRGMGSLESFVGGDGPIDDENLWQIKSSFREHPNDQHSRLVDLVIVAIARWEATPESTINLAREFLEVGVETNKPMFAFYLAQHLFKFSEDERQIERAFSRFAAKQLSKKPNQRKLANLMRKAAFILSSKADFITREELMNLHFRNAADNNDEAAFIEFLNSLTPEKKKAAQLGFVLADDFTHLQGGKQ